MPSRTGYRLVPLPEILAATKILKVRIAEFSLQQRWLELMGAHIAGHTYPDAIRHRKLYVVAENSVWLQQLVFLKAELLARISTAFGQDFIDDIVLKVGLVRTAQSQMAAPSLPEEPPERSVLEDTAGVRSKRLAAMEDSLQGIANPILLERLKALFLKSAIASSLGEGPSPDNIQILSRPPMPPSPSRTTSDQACLEKAVAAPAPGASATPHP